jgi:guanosine-3',5'-bis(diphosphate) 3'-pyrophosphohydrolase
MIIHPIDVANILEEQNFDDNVIAAGYLHDVVEDTNYTINDIEKNFGEDIASLVYNASEPDKSLIWEERKKHTIENTKNLDLRHKAIICADKISNLEDLRIISEIKQNYDFSAFRRDFEDQKWYYENIYNSLIINEDENYIMFKKLKELIDYIFYKKTNDKYEKNILFNDNQNEYKELLKIHYKKEEIYKMLKVLNHTVQYVIEFTGTPRTGKTSLINNLNDFFKKKGFVVDTIEEFTTSKKHKNEIYPLLKDKHKNIINTEIPKYVLAELNEALKNNNDVIIIDRSLFDRLILVNRLNMKKGMIDSEYNDYLKVYIPLIKEKIDIVISTYTDSITALKRDYKANLSLEKRNFLNEDNINEYNKSLINMKELAEKENIRFYMFDTTQKSQREISIEVINVILDNMRNKLINELISKF